ncbi:MAG: efflux transporter outer membrane subunit [Sphingomonadales bacterium]|nr:efflux transporter outer membrane subunit [Sphingomonadales bacterium]
MKRPLTLLLTASLAACSMAPHYQRPAPAVPATWPGDPALRQSEATLPGYGWHAALADPRLQRLVEQALAHNQDVALALANIDAARAQYRTQRASLFPELDASAAYTRSGGDAARTPGDSFSVGGGVSAWELDLFGRVRSLTDVQRQKTLATVATARATRLALVASVAEAWITLGADRSLLAIAQDTARTADDQVTLTTKRVTGGIAPLSDQRQAEIVRATAQADIARQTTLVAQDANALRLLLGDEPAPADLPLSIEDAAARLGEVPVGLDSSVLLKRPDVVAAEYSLKSANANIGAARAALFPKISLTAAFGVASTALSTLFTGGAFSWSAGGAASYPIFSAGKGKAGVALARAQADAALAQYQKAIQSAFKDVANTLARRATIDAERAATRNGLAAASENATLANHRYTGGIASYLDSLTAQQALYTARRTATNTEATRAINLVELYRSLGADTPGE